MRSNVYLVLIWNLLPVHQVFWSSSSPSLLSLPYWQTSQVHTLIRWFISCDLYHDRPTFSFSPLYSTPPPVSSSVIITVASYRGATRGGTGDMTPTFWNGDIVRNVPPLLKPRCEDVSWTHCISPVNSDVLALYDEQKQGSALWCLCFLIGRWVGVNVPGCLTLNWLGVGYRAELARSEKPPNPALRPDRPPTFQCSVAPLASYLSDFCRRSITSPFVVNYSLVVPRYNRFT